MGISDLEVASRRRGPKSDAANCLGNRAISFKVLCLSIQVTGYVRRATRVDATRTEPGFV